MKWLGTAALALALAMVMVMAMVTTTGVWAQTPTTAAEVTKIDKAAGRVTLKHEEIKNLDMPPMTMVFHVRDAKMLDSLAVGNRIRFTAERINGQYTLTLVSKAP